MSHQATCPTCGRAMTARPAHKSVFVQLLDAGQRADLSDTELRTYYASVSAFEDITFWLAHNGRLLDQERAELHELRQTIGTRGGKHTPETRASFARLKANHWTRRLVEDRAAGTPEVSSDGPSLTANAKVIDIQCECKACNDQRRQHRAPLHRIRREGYAEIVTTVCVVT